MAFHTKFEGKNAMSQRVTKYLEWFTVLISLYIKLQSAPFGAERNRNIEGIASCLLMISNFRAIHLGNTDIRKNSRALKSGQISWY